jgi:glycosyltransferase involved in cell wall biosynthesis
MYGTGDALAARGHEIEYWFSEDIEVRWRVQLSRFAVPFRIVEKLKNSIDAGRRWDVVEIHEPSAAAYAWHRDRFPPLVVFSYGLEERFHRAALAYQRLKGLPISLKNRFSPLSIIWQSRYAMRNAAHVICSNSEDVDHLARHGIPRQRLTRHHSGVGDEFIAAGGDLPPEGERRGILFLGSWLPRKGVLDLIPAITEVLRQYPAERLTVAGCQVGEDQILPLFPEGLRPRIQIIPSVEGNAALIQIYRNHSIFVLPSYFEGQPLVMIEAAAMGLAIVTTPICGMRDFIQTDRNGLTVPVGDPKSLAGALSRLLSRPDEARLLGRRALESARTHTWAAAADRIEQAYLHAAGRLSP